QRDAVTVRCRHLDLRAERRFGVCDRHVDDEVGVAALKALRRLDARDDEQVARRAAVRTDLALALEADARALPHAGGDLPRVRLPPHFRPGAVTVAARLLDHRPVPATARARLGQRKQALALRDNTAAVAHGTDHRGRAGLRTGAAANAAR